MTVNAVIRARRGVRRDWTAADIESCLVLIDIGATRPAAKVTRARRGRPLRRAYRAALRATPGTAALRGLAPAERGAR